MSLSQFINNLENIYVNISIYRSIIIAKNEKEAILLSNNLSIFNHNALYINGDNIHNNITNSNYRLFIITYDNYKSFIKNLDIDSYNFIGISYTIDEDNVNNIINYYLDISNNNINNTYILNYYSYYINNFL